MVRFDWSSTLYGDVYEVLLWKLGIKLLHTNARSHSCSKTPRYKGIVQVLFRSTFPSLQRLFSFQATFILHSEEKW